MDTHLGNQEEIMAFLNKKIDIPGPGSYATCDGFGLKKSNKTKIAIILTDISLNRKIKVVVLITHILNIWIKF